MSKQLTRRGLLATGISASLLGSVAFAAAAGGRKLVVIVARGGMDGLSVSPPVGDPNYAVLRGAIAIPASAALKLDETFGLHPKLANLHRLARVGQARIAPAAAIPARIRSHFDAQDLLENGASRVYGASSGWLNRALNTGPAPLKALSVGAQTPLILRGPVQAQSWSPGRGLDEQAERLASMLQDLYAGDALLGPAFASGLQTEAMADALNGATPIDARNAGALAVSTARFLTAPQGPSIAVLSLGGFDTHARQGAVDGQLAGRLQVLDETIAGLESGLGATWKDTVVIVVTEFGRTARVNGTLGLDHGTASTLVLAGGALKRGGIIGDWPGLAERSLFENRDLAPTLDVRSVFKGVLVEHLGLDAARVNAAVFPDSAGARAVTGLV
ncbi:MAG: hypothetical protein B7Y99_07540 [Caulobacterales bacterium 32-69-10]|nr:MAG: hypothetical protein B7Y99_07540 [Caulobacterales bacterium 32-69-10]